jgi:hypothetical protein
MLLTGLSLSVTYYLRELNSEGKNPDKSIITALTIMISCIFLISFPVNVLMVVQFYKVSRYLKNKHQ